MLSWWRNDGAMGGEEGVSPLRWDAEGSEASPSAGPTTHWCVTRASRRRAIKLFTEAAEVASRWLWIRRGEHWVG